MTCRIVIALTNGSKIVGKSAEMTEGEVHDVKKMLRTVMESSDGWQVNLETETGWCIAPKQSVLYVALRRDQP